MNHLLIYPMFAMWALTMLVGLNLFFARKTAFKSGKVEARYFKSMSGPGATPWMERSSRHFSNLFEMPVLFYAACITAMVMPVMSHWILIWAWAFVATRTAHATIHITYNHAIHRMLAFMMGCLCIAGMWIEILISIR